MVQTATDDGEVTAGPGLMVIAGAYGEIAVLVAFFVAVNALGFALRQQHRERGGADRPGHPGH
ncbi:hypothetical protein [Streptomyces noursei]|uniref:hypothetical protein n=1 Tax=Streptomyces noursei TaxID=1971 RepID=UPI003828BC77